MMCKNLMTDTIEAAKKQLKRSVDEVEQNIEIPELKHVRFDRAKAPSPTKFQSEFQPIPKIPTAFGQRQSLNLDDEFDHQADEDLIYLDALAKKDFRTLKKLPSNLDCLSSIFSEIVDNEPVPNSNYRDEVFEKNIQRIFDASVDLDHAEWQPASSQSARESLEKTGGYIKHLSLISTLFLITVFFIIWAMS